MLLDVFQNQVADAARGGQRKQCEVGRYIGLPSHYAVEQAEQQEEGEHPVLLFLDYFLPRERQVGRPEPLEAWDERRSMFRPAQIVTTELAAEELFLGIHYAFVVEPVGKDERNDEPGIARQQRHAQPHQEIAKIERMTHYRIYARRIKHVGHLSARVSPRSAGRRV